LLTGGSNVGTADGRGGDPNAIDFRRGKTGESAFLKGHGCDEEGTELISGEGMARGSQGRGGEMCYSGRRRGRSCFFLRGSLMLRKEPKIGSRAR